MVQYHSNQHHWMLSSSNNAACVVEAGSPEDLSVILQTVGAFRTPFAVYSGGHASNPGFSSTTGVHISLRRFNKVELSKDGKIATLGFGQVRRGWVFDGVDHRHPTELSARNG